ncbi:MULTISPECIES: mycothiol conjugate amidase Mca [Actinomadura]|uniref:Mycothiol S-conjugate amidase n=1 Tax=Actinomadura litoris TaxID=2678616 RepID=A0A7K1KUF0_9ACTN|nr:MULTISPECIES: mycothiol conjugate amidase Mca [Actinomadura]MBT2207377.1 mycothiol conjugate amidase Mca [Actinomadura sp. NEAU-AAG7]MUN35814.1 mycothiol conjugate amidase Mca [Actinomadura litoris]
MTFRLLSVHAHPDDESSKGAATLARYAAEGVDVMVATCTGGERGDVLNPAMDRPDVRADLPAIRRAEMEAARAILGVRHRFLGFTDSGLPGEGEPLPDGCFAVTPLADAARPLVELMRGFRPHVVVTYDETGGYPHPDHVRTHEVTVEAFDASGDPARYPGTGRPWRPLKLYYQGAFSRRWFQALHDGMTGRGLASEIGPILEGWPSDAPELGITTRVRCAEYFAVRDRALLAHATQIDPGAGFMTHPRDVERDVWPTEDYHLARSHVASPTPETDLFAGLAGIAD